MDQTKQLRAPPPARMLGDLSGIPEVGIIDTNTIAAALGVQDHTVHQWVHRGVLPKQLRHGIFDAAEVRAGIERHRKSYEGLIPITRLAVALGIATGSVSRNRNMPEPVYKGSRTSPSFYRATDVLDVLLHRGEVKRYEALAKETGMTDYSDKIGPFTWTREKSNRITFGITCRDCGGGEVIANQNFSFKLAAELLPKKFGERGWRVGRKFGRHVCPACQEKTTDTAPAAPQKAPDMSLTREHVSSTRIPAPPVPAVPASPALPPLTPLEAGSLAPRRVEVRPPMAEPPRLASLDERRIINAKLDDVYASKGYTAGWSDEKVAKDLGVPRAWVAQVREMLFGPDVNEDDAKALAACQDALNKMTQLRADMEKVRQTAALRMDELMQESARLTSHVRDLMAKVR